MRRVNLWKCLTFKDSFEIVWSVRTNTCAFQQVNIVFDSYLDESIKVGERERRTVSQPLVIVNMQEESHIPVQIGKFWANNSNNENLQKLAKEFFINNSIENQRNAVLSGCLSYNEDRCLKAVEVRDEFVFNRADLDVDIEEPDLRIISHVSKSVSRNFTNIVVISNDTDVLILLLHYLPQFIENGLEELWIKFGAGGHSRFIPLHVMYNNMNKELHSVILKAHILTGCDATSKIGTKKGALKASPEKYLSKFGNDRRDVLSYENAESFLAKVLNASSQSNTFNDLRYETYVSKNTPLHQLPPTSYSLRGHLDRSFYVINMCLNLLSEARFSLDQKCLGWKKVDGVLIPDKRELYTPPEYICCMWLQ